MQLGKRQRGQSPETTELLQLLQLLKLLELLLDLDLLDLLGDAGGGAGRSQRRGGRHWHAGLNLVQALPQKLRGRWVELVGPYPLGEVAQDLLLTRGREGLPLPLRRRQEGVLRRGLRIKMLGLHANSTGSSSACLVQELRGLLQEWRVAQHGGRQGGLGLTLENLGGLTRLGHRRLWWRSRPQQALELSVQRGRELLLLLLGEAAEQKASNVA